MYGGYLKRIAPSIYTKLFSLRILDEIIFRFRVKATFLILHTTLWRNGVQVKWEVLYDSFQHDIF